MKRRSSRRGMLLPLVDAGLVVLGASAFATGFELTDIHVWLGLMVAAALAVHLDQHRPALWGPMRRWLSPLALRVRVRAVLNILLLVDVGALVLSGVIVSQIYAPSVSRFHAATAWLMVAQVGLHLALNVRWIYSHLKRLIGRRFSSSSVSCAATRSTQER